MNYLYYKVPTHLAHLATRDLSYARTDQNVGL